MHPRLREVVGALFPEKFHEVLYAAKAQSFSQ